MFFAFLYLLVPVLEFELFVSLPLFECFLLVFGSLDWWLVLIVPVFSQVHALIIRLLLPPLLDRSHSINSLILCLIHYSIK